ncbi:MAG: phosphoadenylyl-sulfate reductase [Dehalococcoidia bacterium]
MAQQKETYTVVEESEKIGQEMEHKSAYQVLEWALDRYHPRISLASSFGAEDVVIIDMLHKINPKARVFSLDTLRLPKETLEVMNRIREKYDMEIEVFYPDPVAVEEMVSKHGVNLFYESVANRKMCCGVRKVEPLNRALSQLEAWISGLRRDQAVTRTKVAKVELDESHGSIIKVNPLADWTWDEVWHYIKENDVPYNALHDKNYPSIGCEPCTRAIKPGEDPRAGRWWWEQDPSQKECGLHSG